MSGKKSRNKGSGYERKIAKILSKWSGMELRRTPLSGGWAKQNPKVSGDLVNISDNEFPLHVECKNQESFEWEPFLHGNGSLKGWWDQTLRTCPNNKIPILVFSRAYYDDWVMLKKKDVMIKGFMKSSNIYINLGDAIIITLKHFITLFSVKDFV